MAFDGNGTFNPLSPQYPAVSGAIIYADDWNNIVADIAAGLSLTLTRDGQTTATADIPMGGFGLTGLRNGVSAQDSTTFTQVFNSPTFQTPTLVQGQASVSPNVNDNSLLLATTAWARTLLVGPVYSAAVNLYNFANFA